MMEKLSLKHASLLLAFYYVAYTRSFTQANQLLYITPSALSKRIKYLEHLCQDLLINRKTKPLRLTKKGQFLWDLLQTVIGPLQRLEQLLPHQEQVKSLRILTSHSVSNLPWLDHFLSFSQHHPGLQIVVTRSEAGVEPFDVALQEYKEGRPDLIQKQLNVFPMTLVASPSYLSQHGFPTTLSDLDTHHLLALSAFHPLFGAEVNWHLYAERAVNDPRVARLSLPTLEALLKAAEQGFGLAPVMKGHSSIQAYTLQEVVLPESKNARWVVYFSYPQHLASSKTIQQLYQAMVGKK